MADSTIQKTEVEALDKDENKVKQSLLGPITDAKQLDSLNLSEVVGKEARRMLENKEPVMLFQQEGREGSVILKGGINGEIFSASSVSAAVESSADSENRVIERGGLEGLGLNKFPFEADDDLKVKAAQIIINQIPEWAKNSLKETPKKPVAVEKPVVEENQVVTPQPQEQANSVELSPLVQADDTRYAQVITTKPELQKFLEIYKDTLSTGEISAIKDMGKILPDTNGQYNREALIFTLEGQDSANLTPTYALGASMHVEYEGLYKVPSTRFYPETKLNLNTSGTPRSVKADIFPIDEAGQDQQLSETGARKLVDAITPNEKQVGIDPLSQNNLKAAMNSGKIASAEAAHERGTGMPDQFQVPQVAMVQTGRGEGIS